MPDHIHFFTTPGEAGIEFERWMQFWKRDVTIKLAIGPGQWQRDQWHTRMRTPQQYQEKWDYVQDNPVRHGLVRHRDAWPFRGELFEIAW